MPTDKLIVYGHVIMLNGTESEVYYVYDYMDGTCGVGVAKEVSKDIVDVKEAYPRNWQKLTNLKFTQR